MGDEKFEIINDLDTQNVITITIPDGSQSLTIRNNFLDESLITKLGVLVMENAHLFIGVPEYKRYYNLLCVIVDRLKSAVEFLNKNSETPEGETQLIVFMTYACMVYDAIGELKTQILHYGTNRKYHDTEKTYFKNVCMSEPWNLSEDDCLTDEEFFEHFRSLTFAHPYNTARRPVLKNKYGIQYSPWVIVDRRFKKVGVTIYSEKEASTQMLSFDFDILKDYIKYRYLKIIEIIEWFESLIENKKAEWKTIKITRSADPIETLTDISRVLNLRCQNFYGTIETLIDFLKYNNTIAENKEIVAKYKKEIESIVPSLCDAIDDADYEKAHKIIDSVLNVTSIDQSKLNYCRSMISDAYYADTNKPWQRYMPFIEDMMKSVSLQVKIDGNILGVLGTFLLFSAMCYFINKDGQDYKINNSD